jgi:glycosyltransferase involved in cell wall biosynthesis
MALHVLQLGPYPPPEGGITRNMLAIRRTLLEQGNRCSIIATSKSTRVEDEPYVYHPGSVMDLVKLLATIDYDVLHLHIGGKVSKRVVGLALLCALFGSKKSILTLHSGAYPLTDEAKHASRMSIRGRIFQRFSHIIAVNEPIADVFRRYGLPPEQVSVIPPYALETPDPKVDVPRDVTQFAEAHSPLVLSIGGLEKDYDPMFQIAAFKDVLYEFPGAGLLMVGDGSMRDDVERAIAVSGYAERIHLAGNVEHGVTLHLINDADVLIRTTLFDGDAISVREAIYLGTPVIATDNGMRPDGVMLYRIGDNEEFLRTFRSAMQTGHVSIVHSAPDTSNIAAVLDLYGC